MTHYGDITKLNGAKLPAVDVITGGSPCQDLSVAGKRAGLAGERSGLFVEQIRVIKEMRQRDRDCGRAGKLIRPRYMVWENVPGAFSSNAGEDFRAVLEETAHIADENAVIPEPPRGKWTTSGAIVGDGWSIAWRVLDAQFWGVPQRRRRIALVADFGGQSAPEILFIRDSLSWDTAESRETGQRTAGDAESSIDSAECMTPWDCQSKRIFSPDGQCPTLQGGIGGGVNNPAIYAPGIARSLTARNDGSPCMDRGPEIVMQSVAGFSYKASPGAGSIGYAEEQAPTILGERQDASIFDARGNGDDNTVPTMTGDHNGHISDFTALCIGNGQANQSIDNTAGALNCMHDQQAVAETGCSVRRLTPLECERLQGYPDGWTDIGDWTDSKGKVHKPSDSARYKALGNSIALPPWRWVLLRITAQYERPATLGSLFDGIGGFPLIWERLNGDGSCLWTSEIEEFCIAITGVRFGMTQERSTE